MSKEAEKEAANAAAKAKKEAEKEAANAAAVSEIVVKFRDHKGEPASRTYSREVHGDDFAKLAEQFKTKHATRIIVE